MTDEIRKKLTEIIAPGLVSGLGHPEPGNLCIEAAICLAYGEAHGDTPRCVAAPDREYAIRLNDAAWSSNTARAEALLPLALAQLGTAGTDRAPWVKLLVEGTIRKVLPLALCAAARLNPEFAVALEEVALRCTIEGTREVALEAYGVAVEAYGVAVEATNASAAARAAGVADNAGRGAYGAGLAALDAAEVAFVSVAGAANAAYDDVLKVAVRVALDAYAAEGRS